MSTQHELGNKGEEAARKFLLEKGYLILEKNWRFGRAEIDIIAKDKSTLVFIEVKSRSTNRYGAPEEFISKKKMKFLTQAASAYMEKINHSWEIRFDVLAILITINQVNQIKHFEDAFFFGV